jgi:serine/threonine-protein kinase PpkA
VDPANKAAAKLRTDSATKLVGQAQQAERTGDGALALTRYDQALQAAPDNAGYKSARAALEQKLGQRQTQIAAALNAAREAIQQQRYFSPPGNNAREAIAQALRIDPANASALSLQSQLPSLARDAAEALGTDGKLEEALVLLGEAQQLYKDDPRIALLKNKLTTERDRARAAGQREQHLGELRELLAKRQLNPDSARAIGFAISSLLKLDPNDADAKRYREQFVSGIARVIETADKPETLRALTPVLEQLSAQLGANSVDVQSLINDHKAAGARIEALVRERLAASSGLLVLNAAPWANVESVIDQGNGRRIELPKDASTPLRLNVPAGTYAVTFRHPGASAPVSRVAGVQAQKTQTISAAFPTITARDYLKRVGYAQ